MFGASKRKRYNGTVDTKLNNEYQIATRNNPSFPGMLAYLELIDNAWHERMTEDEGALYIATLYYCGIVQSGRYEEAAHLLSRIRSIVEFGIPRGIISKERWRACSKAIAGSANKPNAGSPRESLEIAERNLTEEFGISLRDIPERNSVEELFYSMGSTLSPEAKTSLLYRLVVMNYLGSAKISRDKGVHIEPSELVWLTEVIDAAVDWSEEAQDHDDLERATSQLNMNIVRFFESFGVRQGS